MRRLFLLTAVLFLTATGFAMIRTLPLPDLVAKADLIVLAKVAAIGEEKSADQSIPPVKNELSVERVLKGTWNASDPIVLKTFFKPGDKIREDGVVFPEKDRRVLLFLESKDGKDLRILNGIQGLWPIEAGTDKTLGMGFRYSIEKVLEEVNKK